MNTAINTKREPESMLHGMEYLKPHLRYSKDLMRSYFHIGFYCAFAFVVLFLPRRNWSWIEGWLFLLLLGSFLLVSLLALARDPYLLGARVSFPFRRGQPSLDKILFALTSLLHLLWIVGIGLDPLLKGTPRIFGRPWEAFGGMLFLFATTCMYRIVGDNPFLIPAVSRQAGQQVVTRGIYGLVRHPMYAALISMSIGGSLLTSSPLGLAVSAMIFAALWCRLVLEERFMRSEFPEYITYAQRVRYRLFPLLF